MTRQFWRDSKPAAALPAGHVLAQPELLFAKVEDDVIEQQLEKLQKMKIVSPATEEVATAPAEVAPAKQEIQYEDFAKLDIRVATIVAAEKVEKADKLLKLTLDAGGEKRTVVSGIALHYNAVEIVGRQVLLLANLAPRKMRGIESQGMILMAEDENGKLVFVAPEFTVNAGSGVS